MSVYNYVCPECDLSFDVKKPMSEASRAEYCPECGKRAERKYTPAPFSFGWKLSDKCLNEKGVPDELVKNI